MIRTDCGRWLDEVEKSLPTVVLSAKDADGRYVIDMKVSVDGRPLATKLDGQAVPMNPGVHSFLFERADGTSFELQAPVREGEKNQSIVGEIPRRGAAEAGARPSSPAAAASPPSDDAVRPTSSFPWTTIGWSAAALGTIGLGVGTVFGVMAASDKSDAACDARGVCAAGPLESARRNALIANVGFITGGVLLAGGLGLVLFAPKSENRSGVLRMAPTMGAREKGLVVEGVW